MRALVSVCALVLLVGCAVRDTEQLPTYPAMSPSDALRVLRARTEKVKSVSATGALTLTRPNGESVRFDAAIVMQAPENLRLRAWKMGQAVFDLTITRSEAWLLTPDRSSRAQEIRSAGVDAAELSKMWAMFTAQFFERDDLALVDHEQELIVTAVHGERTIKCHVERRSLTPRRYEMFDANHRRRFELMLAQYAVFGEIPWPKQLIATSDSGVIQIDLRDVELNGEVAAGAFVPPRRAEKLP
jgi:outer membrane lipoprotein-sorting protein